MSEFRKDAVSGDWIVMAPERAARPHNLKNKTSKRQASPLRTCPFEHPEKTGNWPPLHEWPGKGKWEIILLPNKFPALHHDTACVTSLQEGLHESVNGIGWHDILVTRDHRKDFPKLSPKVAAQVLAMFQTRYKEAATDKCIQYVSAFANWGATAGASLFHPHYQLLAVPIIPPHVNHALRGAETYFKAKGRCVHCDIIANERRRRKCLIAENAHAVALAPFASREPYAVQIFPKKHLARFEASPPAALGAVAALLQKVLARMSSRLGDPDYNFFIHSAPLKQHKKFSHYHWHVEVAPKMNISAGFEISTGVDINTVLPEKAAKDLR